jgi:hypothetical protein
MSSPPETTLVLLGLKGTGKTHFLVGLDVVLDDQSDPDGLVHTGPAADRAYLQPLREKWLRGEDLDHTSRSVPPPPHQLLTRHPPSGTIASLYLPDLAGETFDANFVTRSLPIEACHRFQNCAGLLLFVHCDEAADHTILQHPGFIDPVSISELVPTEQPAAETVSKWRLEDAARQVKLVDLLQFIAEIGPQQKPLSVAVIISAWDLVENAPNPGPRAAAEMPKDPARFLSIHWPLLDQFLQSNADTFRSRVFGVSARGGGLTAAEIKRLVGFDRPAERVLVVDGPRRSNDLTRPVRWVLGLMDSASPSNA